MDNATSEQSFSYRLALFALEMLPRYLRILFSCNYQTLMHIDSLNNI